jgi:hypothetical protein
MPPRYVTRGHSLAQADPSAAWGNTDPLVEDPIAQALNQMVEIIQHMTENTRHEKHRLIAEGDQALKRFLKFHSPQYFGNPDSE